MIKAIEWVDTTSPAQIRLIDQTQLPQTEKYLEITEVSDLVDAIQVLAVRGAPALGAAGGYGVALAIQQGIAEGWSDEELQEQILKIRDARPTAVNLAWGSDRVTDSLTVLTASPEALAEAVAEANLLAEEDEAANRKLSRAGADWLIEKLGDRPLRAVTHCNTGALATTAWGTAYGILHELYNRGNLEFVYVDETRPLLQGTRLTSWELKRDGIPHAVEPDGAAASTILRGFADFAVIGADRITLNGDTANKIGSAAVALAADYAGIPFVVAAPFSTVDVDTKTGSEIEIEERPDAEVLAVGDKWMAAEGVKAFNPAFDVTPHDLISAIVTEKGVVEPTKEDKPLF